MSVAENQATLLNLETKELNPYWVDPKQPLKVPVNPLHYAAHRYQLILERLDIQARNNPAQFNSGNYIQILEKLEALWQKINLGDNVAVHDTRNLAENRDESSAPAVGKGDAPGLFAGVSADNPLAGQGSNTV